MGYFMIIIKLLRYFKYNFVFVFDIYMMDRL